MLGWDEDISLLLSPVYDVMVIVGASTYVKCHDNGQMALLQMVIAP